MKLPIVKLFFDVAKSGTWHITDKDGYKNHMLWAVVYTKDHNSQYESPARAIKFILGPFSFIIGFILGGR